MEGNLSKTNSHINFTFHGQRHCQFLIIHLQKSFQLFKTHQFYNSLTNIINHPMGLNTYRFYHIPLTISSSSTSSSAMFSNYLALNHTTVHIKAWLNHSPNQILKPVTTSCFHLNQIKPVVFLRVHRVS